MDDLISEIPTDREQWLLLARNKHLAEENERLRTENERLRSPNGHGADSKRLRLGSGSHHHQGAGEHVDVEILSAAPPQLRPLTAEEFLMLDLPPREMIIRPWMPQKGLVMIYSKRGIGKTHFGLAAAYAIACGEGFLGFEVAKARKVLFIDGEMPGAAMQRRLASIVAGSAKQPPDPSYFRILCADTIEAGLPDLGTTAGQATFDAVVGDAEVVFVDNLSSLVRNGKENEGESWLPVQGWGLAHRRAGRSVVLIHHAGKGGEQRGTSRREDVLDTVISLRRPSDYRPDQGARFEVHFDKARSFYGDDACAFEAKYEERDGAAMWTRAEIADVEIDRVATALNEGGSIRDVASELQMSKSKVDRLKKKAAGLGKLK
jgi:putative DNA primase/helicase